MPVKHFVASVNVNDTVVKYLETGDYEPKASIPTISNAMDVGNPSNFIRIQQLFDNSFDDLKKGFSSYSFNDTETRDAMKEINELSDYIADPHGAVGYLGLKKHGLSDNEYGIFLETAHPVKFLDIVEETLNTEVAIPEQIKEVLDKEKVFTSITKYEELKSYLLNDTDYKN